MRALIVALGASAVAAAGGPAHAMDAPMIFHTLRADIDAARIDDEDVVNWDAEAWIGGDVNRLWLKSEGAAEGGDVGDAEIQALWSRNVAPFWDLQAGVRVDLEPDATAYLAFGVQGLSPYQFETEATAFVSEDGDVSARLRQSLDVRFTQRLILEPHAEIEAFAQDVADREIGAGFAHGELGLQLRYEITREFAPYLDTVYERALGETASRVRTAGGDVSQSSLRAGVRLWF